jgi:hypothetical protein
LTHLMIEARKGQMMALVDSVLIVINSEVVAEAFLLDVAEVARMDGQSLSLVWVKMASLAPLEELAHDD